MRRVLGREKDAVVLKVDPLGLAIAAAGSLKGTQGADRPVFPPPCGELLRSCPLVGSSGARLAFRSFRAVEPPPLARRGRPSPLSSESSLSSLSSPSSSLESRLAFFGGGACGGRSRAPKDPCAQPGRHDLPSCLARARAALFQAASGCIPSWLYSASCAWPGECRPRCPPAART